MANWSISPTDATINSSGVANFPRNTGNNDKPYTITYTDNDGCSSSITYTLPPCGKEYVEIVPLPPRKKLQKLENKVIDDNCNLNKDTCTFSKEEEEEKKKIIKNQQTHKNFLKHPNFTTQNNEIYPFWWWNNKEEDIRDNKINMTYDQNINNNEYYDNENYYNNESNNINEEDNIIQDKRNEDMNNIIKNFPMTKIQNQNANQQVKENISNNKNNFRLPIYKIVRHIYVLDFWFYGNEE